MSRNAGELWVSPSTGMEFVWIPPGEFAMGSEDPEAYPYQEPVHRVRITRGFWLGKYPVTQAQWQIVMGDNPSYFLDPQRPVECVIWEECRQFLQKLSERGEGRFRLPTEAEWEYAARAGSVGKYCYGDDPGLLGEYGWYDANSGEASHPVGQKEPNRWGLYDVHGNVSEWCEDWYGSYPSGEVIDPQGPASGEHRVVRGGFWGGDAWELWVSDRDGLAPDFQGRGVGFRCVREEGAA